VSPTNRDGEPNDAGGFGSAADLIPAGPTLPRLRVAAAECTACRLYRGATQTVFGEGTSGAKVILVGEQPGDREDVQGKPFVGPAGRLLDRALEDAGIDRTAAYVTNVVKHFKFERRGKRRIHKKPAADEIAACPPGSSPSWPR
jgi:uracil-DNA glycosylase